MPPVTQKRADAPAAAATNRFMWQENTTISMPFLYRFLNSALLILPPVPIAPAFLKLQIRWEKELQKKVLPPPTPMSLICFRITIAPYVRAAEDRLIRPIAFAATAENPFDTIQISPEKIGADFFIFSPLLKKSSLSAELPHLLPLPLPYLPPSAGQLQIPRKPFDYKQQS